MTKSNIKTPCVCVIATAAVSTCLLIYRWEMLRLVTLDQVFTAAGFNNVNLQNKDKAEHLTPEDDLADTEVKADLRQGWFSNFQTNVDFYKIKTSDITNNSVIGEATQVDIIDTRGLNRVQASDLICTLFKNGLLNFTRVARFPLKNEWLSPMDKEIQADKPLQDLTRVASPETSQLEFLSLPQNVKVGDNVTVRVILRDANNRTVTNGGHELRVWMVTNEPINSAAAVDVRDLRNGNYLATLPVLWSGKIEVRAALQRPREFRRIIMFLLDAMKIISPLLAAFVHKNTEQVTMCSFIPVVPGFREVCNLTSQNSNLPWYCGKPTEAGLQCEHWSGSSSTLFPRRYPVLSDVESLLLSPFQENKYRPKLKSVISFAAEETQAIKTRTCVPLQPRDTWTDQSPRGYWENKVWYPVIGCSLVTMTKASVCQCFRNTSIIMLGDSNSRQIVEHLVSLLPCREDRDRNHPNLWHTPMRYKCDSLNTSVFWYPHANPFNTGRSSWSDSHIMHAPSVILDALPSSGNYVILIHLYLHFAQAHITIYDQHVRDVARAVRDLLKRNSNVMVFIRGPHAVDGNTYGLPGDYHAERCFRVLRKEFWDIRDKVILLNAWDMTVAIENTDTHPPRYVQSTITNMILTHYCPNEK